MNDRIGAGVGGWMLLRADALRLLLPLAEVGAAEHLDGTPQPSGQPGLFELAAAEPDGAPRFVAALSARLQPLPELPPARFVVTPFPAQPGVVLAWDEARLLAADTVALRPLPAAMCAPESPLTHYAEVEGQPAFACSAERVLGYAFASAS